MISSNEIRDRFIKFFEAHSHLKIPNASIIPNNDPTLLFINSGMAPLKKYFTGEETPPAHDLCNIQPCIRTIDIDEVGDKHHLTSFQMLGSWSINNYFKKEAIELAFDFLVNHLQLPLDKLYVTVFKGDEQVEGDIESKKHWAQVGIDKQHIIECPREDNFWGPTSETGPCGPCTEVFYDTGKGIEYTGEYFDTTRYIEIWNAGVFMQFNKNADGSYSSLAFNSVDTGAGLERLTMAMNNLDSVYETDLLLPIRKFILQMENLPDKDVLILTDHLRTVTLILSAGIKPSNEGRGYIPRKLIRKCIMIAPKAFDFSSVIKFILNEYVFSEAHEQIVSTFEVEREQFEKVLAVGLERLRNIKTLSADETFELVATYGLPFDIIKDYANTNGISIDEQGFIIKFDEHKNISRKTKCDIVLQNDYPETKFVGYDAFSNHAKVLGFDNGALIVDETCFYAESGGQCADVGFISNDNFKMQVENVQRKNGIVMHFGKILFGIPSGNVFLEVDNENRNLLANNHSAVHLLHAALKNLYGDDVNQAGSKVEPDKLRFDFTCSEKLDVIAIEQLVNQYIRMNLQLSIEYTDLTHAIESGVTALFRDKYSEIVRVVRFGNLSQELCGGTHTKHTGSIGMFIITSTESIGKGIKRITALTGDKALQYVREKMTEQKQNQNEKSKTKLQIDYELCETQSKIKYACVMLDTFEKGLQDSITQLSDKLKLNVICIKRNGEQVMIATTHGSHNAKNMLNEIIQHGSGKGGGNNKVASCGNLKMSAQEIISVFEKLL